MAFSLDEAENIGSQLGGLVRVVKSQIHAGDRDASRLQNNPEGKGGVGAVKSVPDVATNAGEMLVIKQTGPSAR
jgi:succinyl-CoA synthetase beta subunit